jgi:hypothetical protein
MNDKKIDIKEKLAAIQKIVDTLEVFPPEDIRDIISFSLKQLSIEEVVEEQLNTVGVDAQTSQTLISDDIYNFVREKAPKNEYQRVAVLAYFLEQKRNMQSVTAKDIVDANTEARQPRFSNISTTMNRTSANYRYINSLKRGVYQLSATGLDLVAALPDQSEIPKLSGTKTTSKRKK